MSIPAEQRDVAAFLRGLAGADPIETHISLVFLGEDTVWKLKKAVRLSFLDFTHVEDRRRFAERELALNRPHAEGMYRDVVAIIRRPDGAIALATDPADGPVLDWVLRMARVPAADFLDVIAAEGRLTPDLLDQVADSVAACHAALAVLRDVRPDMVGIVTGNARAARDAGLPEPEVARWEAAAVAALQARAGWLDARAAAGFVRRAHGDLHLGNLCLWRGRPVLFDALEFDEALATIDLAYDLAFLLMDLDVRASRAAANRVLGRYVGRTGDADLVRGLPPFLSSRALIRGHVAARSGRMEEATQYLARAHRYLEPVAGAVVAVGGLPGTGKSTLARAIAPGLGAAPGALVLRSDEIRKRLSGVAPEVRLPQSAYTPAFSVRVFAELADLAERAASAGHVVIADATFMDPAHRTLIEAAARRAGVPFIGIWLQAPLKVLEARVAARTGDASDATVEVVRSASGHDPGAGTWVAVDATDAATARDLATEALRPHVVLT